MDTLGNKDPWAMKSCMRATCLLCCSQMVDKADVNKPATCGRENVVYRISCDTCAQQEPPVKAHYFGETARTGFLRGQEHLSGQQKELEENPLSKHDKIHHGGAHNKYSMKVIRTHKKPLGMQIHESTEIQHSTADILLNSKGEFNGPRIPRITIEVGARLISSDYPGQQQQQQQDSNFDLKQGPCKEESLEDIRIRTWEAGIRSQVRTGATTTSTAPKRTKEQSVLTTSSKRRKLERGQTLLSFPVLPNRSTTRDPDIIVNISEQDTEDHDAEDNNTPRVDNNINATKGQIKDNIDDMPRSSKEPEKITSPEMSPEGTNNIPKELDNITANDNNKEKEARSRLSPSISKVSTAGCCLQDTTQGRGGSHTWRPTRNLPLTLTRRRRTRPRHPRTMSLMSSLPKPKDPLQPLELRTSVIGTRRSPRFPSKAARTIRKADERAGLTMDSKPNLKRASERKARAVSIVAPKGRSYGSHQTSLVELWGMKGNNINLIKLNAVVKSRD